MIVCTKIIYEALGQQYICYGPKNLTEAEAYKIIAAIAPAALIMQFINTATATTDQFQKLNIEKVKEWLTDLKTYENE